MEFLHNIYAQPFAAAILAIGTTDPTPHEIALMKALRFDRIDMQHVAFASFCRRMSDGEPPEECRKYLEPAELFGEIEDAWEAVRWLTATGEALRVLRAFRKPDGPLH